MDYSPSLSTDLIKDLGLIPHPEGGMCLILSSVQGGAYNNAFTGFFAETNRQVVKISSPYADGALRSLATSIYYLLTADQPSGKIHMNKSIVRRLSLGLGTECLICF